MVLLILIYIGNLQMMMIYDLQPDIYAYCRNKMFIMKYFLDKCPSISEYSNMKWIYNVINFSKYAYFKFLEE